MKNQSGNVQVLFGADGIKQAYEMSLKSEKVDIVCLSSNYASIVGDYFDKDYAPRLFGSRAQTREVLPDNKGNREDAKKKDTRKNQVKFLKIFKNSESDLMLFNNQAILVSYNQKVPFAVLVEDPDLVTNLQNQFENLWERL